MKILSINKFFWRKGGSETVFFGEKEMLESKGHSVIPFSMKSDKNEVSEYSKYFVEEVDYSKPGLINKLISSSKIIYSFDAKSKMELLLQAHEPEIAHFHIFQHQISPSVFEPLRKNNVPIILTLHDLKPMCPNYQMYVNGRVCEDCKGGKFYNCFVNRCTKGSTLGSLVNTIEMYFHYLMKYYQNVDRFIAVSRFHRDKMVEFGFPEHKIDYLPNYIDASSYEPADSMGEYVLYFGRLSKEKGLFDLFEAAKECPDVPIRVVGTGPLEGELVNKINADKIVNVELLGYQSGEALKAIVKGATCVVVPSTCYENCPMTILEAYASGRMVIGSNIGGIPELINDGEDGFVFEPASPHELSEKIKWVWDNRELAQEMGRIGRRKIERGFSVESHYRGLMSVYNSVSRGGY